MTQEEFWRWWRQHRAAFPSVNSWIGNHPKESAEQPTQKEILTGWFEVLADCDLADCLSATQLLQRGDEEPPRLQEDHARTVRRIARRLREQRNSYQFAAPTASREESFRCLDCRDSGTVTCWHPRSQAAMREGRFGQAFTVYPNACFRCPCEAGARLAKVRTWMTMLAVYDPVRCVPKLGPQHADDVARLREWAENYQPTFGREEFNPSAWNQQEMYR